MPECRMQPVEWSEICLNCPNNPSVCWSSTRLRLQSGDGRPLSHDHVGILELNIMHLSIHHLPPVVSNTYNLRQRRHQRQLSVNSDERNFVARKLRQDTYLPMRSTTVHLCIIIVAAILSLFLVRCILLYCCVTGCAIAFCQVNY